MQNSPIDFKSKTPPPPSILDNFTHRFSWVAMPSLKLRIVFAVVAREELLPPVTALVEGFFASSFLTPNQLLMFAVVQLLKLIYSPRNLGVYCQWLWRISPALGVRFYPSRSKERGVMQVSEW
jgi:hypothetical protein